MGAAAEDAEHEYELTMQASSGSHTSRPSSDRDGGNHNDAYQIDNPT